MSHLTKPHRATRGSLLAALGIFLSSVNLFAGDPEVANFAENIFATDAQNLTEITRLGWTPDGTERLFLTRLRGEVRIIKAGQVLPTPFATLDPIYVNGECGLLGLCFDPNFSVNHYVYLFVTVSPQEQQIVRYTDRDDLGLEKTVLIRNLPTRGSRHNGGGLAIGPDGKLYWGIGDNGESVGAKANLTSLASKIGRANLDGSPANDNPFFDGAGPNNDYIWARGFRNPFAIYFQPANGKFWINDVGGDYEQVFIVNAGEHGGWDFYEANQPAGYIKPVIKYRTNGTDTRTIPAGGTIRQNNLVLVTTSEPHGLLRGEKIQLAGNASASFNGQFFVESVKDSTTFAIAQPGPDEAGGGGTVSTFKLGGSVTGGTFYNSTAFPREYWGNLFFGDYNSGRLLRAAFDSNNEVTRVDTFATAIRQFLDVCVGPDGALYYAGHNTLGTIYRFAYKSKTPKIVVHPTELTMVEGGKGMISVRLAAAPSSSVRVDVGLISGGKAFAIGGASNLVFTPVNWKSGQAVAIEAAEIRDGAASVETVALAAPGFETQRVRINAIDQTNSGLVLSSSFLDIPEGSTGNFTVRLAEAPLSDVTVNVTRAAGDTNVTVNAGQTLVFTRENFSVPQAVAIRAEKDSDALNSSASIVLSAAGYVPRTIVANAIDNDPLAPTIVSTPPTRAILGSALSFSIAAQGNPRPTYSLLNAPADMSLDPASGNVSWIPSVTGTFSILAQAANGVLPNATQSFDLSVTNDSAPLCRITKPSEGEIVSGARSEWFGDGIDDVGTTKAEFYVDGALAYTDINNLGHFHFGGEHLHWDTTVLSDGPHRLKMVVYDTKSQATSSEVSVFVLNAPSNQNPQVSLRLATPGPAFVAPAKILLEASASDPDDGISKLELFVNNEKLGEANLPQLSLAWLNPAPGIYTLTARAFDHRGGMAVSEPIQIEVLEYLGFEADAMPRSAARGDGVVGNFDWEQIGRFVAGLDSIADTNEFARVDCAPRQNESGLIRGDGIISLIDWVQAGRYQASLDLATPTGGPTLNQAVPDFRAAVIGNNIASGRKLEALVRPFMIVGETNFITVELDSQGDENGASFSLRFESEKLRYVQAALGQDAANATLLVNTSEVAVGTLGVVLALPPGKAFAQGKRQLVRITLTALPGSEGTTVINFLDHPVWREISNANANRLGATYSDAAAAVKSGLSIAALARTDGTVQIECEGVPERIYSVQVSKDLLVWTTLFSLTADGDGKFSFAEKDIVSAASRFYRISN